MINSVNLIFIGFFVKIYFNIWGAIFRFKLSQNRSINSSCSYRSSELTHDKEFVFAIREIRIDFIYAIFSRSRQESRLQFIKMECGSDQSITFKIYKTT